MCEHEEKFTKCDKCKKLEECKKNGSVINVQYGCEEFSHYALKIGAICEKDRYVEELLDECKKLNDRHQSDCITINQLNVTIDVLVNKLARLREVHGL